MNILNLNLNKPHKLKKLSFEDQCNMYLNEISKLKCRLDRIKSRSHGDMTENQFKKYKELDYQCNQLYQEYKDFKNKNKKRH